MRKTFKKQPGLKQARTTLKHAQVLYDYYITKKKFDETTYEALHYMFTRESRYNAILNYIGTQKNLERVKQAFKGR